MSFKKRWQFLRATETKLALLWIDVKYSVLEWVMLKTWKFRLKHSKFLRLSSMAYNTTQSTWDDVDVEDQWGFWLPLGFGIISKTNWEFDNQMNRDHGYPEEPWQDVTGDDNWKSYYFKDDFLNSTHYFAAARKHLADKLGELIYDKEFILSLNVTSQKFIDDETKDYIDWVAKGSPKFKVEFTDQAKEDLKKMLGDDAQDIFDEMDKKNKDIDDQQK